jgi:thioredoxin-like negative regulator of GroEL
MSWSVSYGSIRIMKRRACCWHDRCAVCGVMPGAAEELSHVIRLNPGNSEARRLLTRLRGEIGQRLDRRDRGAVLRYARLCAIPESYDRAADYYRLALELEDEPVVHLEFARMLSWAGRHADSAYHYEHFLDASPANADVLLELGRVYNASSQFPQAVVAFERCLAKQPDHVPAALDLARALIWSGREDEAAARLRGMVHKKTGGEVPLLLLATIARFQHRVLDEYELLSQVVALVPDQPEARERIAVLEQDSLLDEARLVAHLQTSPDDMEARRQLADLYIKARRHGDALHQLSVIQAAMPTDQAVMERLREVRDEETRRVREQIKTLRDMRAASRQGEIARIQKWLELNAGDMKSRLRLAELYAESGNYAEAATHLEWLTASEPGNVNIQQTLSRIQLLLADRERQAGKPDSIP